MKKIVRIFLVFLVLSISIVSCVKSSMTEEKMEQLIKQEVPLGSSKNQVEFFLDQRNIEHSDYTESDMAPIVVPPDYGSQNGKKRYIVAVIRDVKRHFLTTFSMYIVFYFDDNKNLIEHKINILGKGL
jgi:hypothetical protein